MFDFFFNLIAKAVCKNLNIRKQPVHSLQCTHIELLNCKLFYKRYTKHVLFISKSTTLLKNELNDILHLRILKKSVRNFCGDTRKARRIELRGLLENFETTLTILHSSLECSFGAAEIPRMGVIH